MKWPFQFQDFLGIMDLYGFRSLFNALAMSAILLRNIWFKSYKFDFQNVFESPTILMQHSMKQIEKF